MMLMPMSTSAILVRDHRHLDAAFDQSAPYLFHPRPGETRSGDIGQRTLQCSKRFDALKLWVALRHYGLGHFASLQERMVANAVTLHWLILDAGDFEPAHSPQSNILCFRWAPADAPDPDTLDGLQQELRERYNASGQGWITTTVLDGRRVLRVTLMNPRTEPHHLQALLDGLRDTGRSLVNG
jgi:L-2,4-diaminobutyrate decarboxylase